MGKMPVPCYGCGGTIAVDPRRSPHALAVAGWTLEHGETYCPTCRAPEANHELSAEPALWHAGTRTALERYRHRAPVAIAGGTGLLVVLGGVMASRLLGAHHGAAVPGSWLRPLIMGVVLGLGLIVGGVNLRRRTARWGVMLARTPWRLFRLAYLPPPRRGGFSAVALAPVKGQGVPLLLRLGPVFKWRAATLRGAEGQIVWLAGEPASGRVLGLPPGPELVPLGAPSRGQRARYEQAEIEPAAAGATTEFERRAGVRRAFRAVQLRALVIWLEATLLTTARASLIGIALAPLYLGLLAWTLARARRAREDMLGAR